MASFKSIFWSKNIRNSANFPQANEAYRAGQSYLGAGKSIFDSAISSIDAENADYAKRIAAGLPEDTTRAYRQQQGRISDETARSNNAFAANLQSRARASGGAITPQAALDAQVEQSAGTSNAAFNARNSLAADEASRSLDYTMGILNAISQANATKLGAGISEQNLGRDIYNNALNVMLQRRAAVGKTLASFAAIAGSSRDIKRDIAEFSEEDAIRIVSELSPVKFTYKDSNEPHVGFIAEDVPEFVATPGRKSLNAMDFVGVLTKFAQAQEKTIAQLTARIDAMESRAVSMPTYGAGK